MAAVVIYGSGGGSGGSIWIWIGGGIWHGLVVVYGYGFRAAVVDGRGDDDGAAAA